MSTTRVHHIQALNQETIPAPCKCLTRCLEGDSLKRGKDFSEYRSEDGKIQKDRTFLLANLTKPA